MTRSVPVGRAGLVAVVDDEDYERVAAHRWYPVHSDGLTYAVRRFHKDGRRRSQYMHTFVCGYVRTDHVNHDGLDNQRLNLRAATARQNIANCRPRRGTTSQYKGVYWDKRAKKWAARIRTASGRLFLGLFVDELAAAAAYDTAAVREHGEFACTNGQTGEWRAPVRPELSGTAAGASS